MSYEIVWTRMLSLGLGSSTYAITIVLGIFLLGISLGALAYARFARERPPTAFGLSVVLLGLAIWVAASVAAIPLLPSLIMVVAQTPGVSFTRVIVLQTGLGIALLGVPTILLGMALPMAMGVTSRALGQVGRDVGGIYLVNTLGAILGSIITGFLLIPSLGTQRTLLAGLVANILLVAVGVLLFGQTRFRRWAGIPVVALVGCFALLQPAWPAVVYDSGLGYRLDQVNARTEDAFRSRLRRRPTRLLSLAEGLNATISVRQYRNGISLLLNGKPDASTVGDMTTQALSGIIPLAVHPRPEAVAIVGWGSGVTTHVASLFPETKRVDAIEIEEAVVDASPYFRPVNRGVETDKKVNVIYDDARSRLLTSAKMYDVIISEPSNPWMIGVSSLFSEGYYRLAKRRLKPGGIFGQWLQLYRIDAQSVALILQTLLHSFSEVQVWFTDPSNLILLASNEPIHPSLTRIEELYRHEPLLPLYMGVYGCGAKPGEFFGCFLLGKEELKKITARFPKEVMTDDLPVLEYRATRRIYKPAPVHIDSFWQLKRDARALLPTGLDREPSLAEVLAGAARITRSISVLSQNIAEWGLQHVTDGPELRLAYAKAPVA